VLNQLLVFLGFGLSFLVALDSFQSGGVVAMKTAGWSACVMVGVWALRFLTRRSDDAPMVFADVERPAESVATATANPAPPYAGPPIPLPPAVMGVEQEPTPPTRLRDQWVLWIGLALMGFAFLMPQLRDLVYRLTPRIGFDSALSILTVLDQIHLPIYGLGTLLTGLGAVRAWRSGHPASRLVAAGGFLASGLALAGAFLLFWLLWAIGTGDGPFIAH
jgi:hypothetical protein